MTAIVVADTVERANKIARGIDGILTVGVSPRSVRAGGGCRGIVATQVLVDASAWPLDDDVAELLAPSLITAPNPIITQL